MKLRYTRFLLFVMGIAAWGGSARAAPEFLVQAYGPYTSANAQQSFAPSCASADSAMRFVITFEPTTTMTDFVAFEGLLGVYFDSSLGPLPPFWRLDPGGCNEGGMSISLQKPPELGSAILNPWAGDAGAGVAMAAGTSGDAAERIAFLSYRSTPVTVASGKRYFACTLAMPLCAAQFCSGCDAPIDMVGLQATVDDVNGPGTQYLSSPSWLCINKGCSVRATTPDPVTARTAMSALLTRATPAITPPVCDQVPAHHESWGRLKLLYR